MIELMGSMIYPAAQKHRSAPGCALSQNISAPTSPLKDIICKRSSPASGSLQIQQRWQTLSHKSQATNPAVFHLAQGLSSKPVLSVICAVGPCARGRCQSLKSPGRHPCPAWQVPELGRQGRMEHTLVCMLLLRIWVSSPAHLLKD